MRSFSSPARTVCARRVSRFPHSCCRHLLRLSRSLDCTAILPGSAACLRRRWPDRSIFLTQINQRTLIFAHAVNSESKGTGRVTPLCVDQTVLDSCNSLSLSFFFLSVFRNHSLHFDSVHVLKRTTPGRNVRYSRKETDQERVARAQWAVGHVPSQAKEKKTEFYTTPRFFINCAAY